VDESQIVFKIEWSGKEEESRPFVANGRDYADGVSLQIRQMPSVCLERCLAITGQATLVKEKLGLEMVNLTGLGRIESISWRV